jgi:hypothetical protein
MDFPHFIPSQNPLKPPIFLVVKSLNPRIQYFLVVKPFKPHEHGYLLTQLLVSWPLHPTVGDTKRCGWWMAGWELDLRQNGPPKPGLERGDWDDGARKNAKFCVCRVHHHQSPQRLFKMTIQ